MTIAEFVQRYSRHASLMVEEVWGIRLDKWQRDVLDDYARVERRISIRSAHGVGKTAVAAWSVIHHLLTRAPSKTVVTAPSSTTLWDSLWSEILLWFRRLPPELQALYKVTSDRIELAAAPEEVFLTARTSRADQPEALQGIHSDSVLMVIDEASGVPEPVFEAGIGSMSGATATTILISNPTKTGGTFYESQTRLKHKWKTYHVTAFDCSRVTPDFITDVIDRYGEDSAAYDVRVMGNFPRQEEDVLIPREHIVAATTRDIVPLLTTPRVWGVDVARYGNDRSALVIRAGRVVPEPPLVWKNLDTMRLAGHIKRKWDETADNVRPVVIFIDVIGIGAGVVDRLRELGLPVRGINVSEQASLKEKYRNLRTELAFEAKMWFSRMDCSIPNHLDLVDELASIRYHISESTGKDEIESKDEQKKLLRRSPDVADAFCLTFADEASTLLEGRSPTGQGRGLPLRRNVRAA